VLSYLSSDPVRELVMHVVRVTAIFLCENMKQFIPSKMLPIHPGPSSTDSGLPVRNTGSPTVTPAGRYIEENIMSSLRAI